MDWIIPMSVLTNTPSRADMIKESSEKVYRARTTWFIEVLGKELFKPEQNANQAASTKLNNHSRLIVSTAQVLFHRFYVYQSFKQHDRFIMATAALFLASKVEEAFFFRVDRVVKVYLAVRNLFKDANVKLMETDPKEIELKVLLAERILLQTLCFDLQITHPYKYLVDKVKDLRLLVDEDRRQEFYQSALNFLNDSYRTTLCLQYQPHQIAVSAVFLATLHLGLEPVTGSSGMKIQVTGGSNNNSSSSASGSGSGSGSGRGVERAWFDHMKPAESNLDEESVMNICSQLLALYHSDSSVWTTIVPPAASELQSRLVAINPKAQSDYTKSSPNTVANPLSSSHAAGPADWKARFDEAETAVDTLPISSAALRGYASNMEPGAYEEVDLNDPYPYDDDASAEDGADVAESRKSTKVTVFQRSMSGASASAVSEVASSVVSGASSPYTDAGSPPPPPPSDTPGSMMMSSDSRHAYAGDSSSYGGNLDISSLSNMEAASSFSVYPYHPFQAPPSAASSGSDAFEKVGFTRGRSLSATSSDLAGEDSPPPPPPPDTPQSSFSASCGRDELDQSPKRQRIE